MNLRAACKLPSRGKCCKVSCQGYNRIAPISFEPRLYQLRLPSINASATLSVVKRIQFSSVQLSFFYF